MKRKFRFIFPFLLLGLPLTGCDWITIKDNEEAETVIIDKFYKDYDLTKTGGRLIQELQKMCFDKHTQWVEYGQISTYGSKTNDHNSIDAIADGSNKNQYFYTGKEASGFGTREHVWPCANSGELWTHGGSTGSFSPHNVDNQYYIGGGSDLFHVRPSSGTINTARGNSRFGPLDSSEEGVVSLTESGGKYALKIYGANKTSAGNYEYASKAEPADEMKGDVARIILYVYVHYQERGDTPSGYVTAKNGNKFNFTDMTGPLSLKSIMDGESEDACKELLKEWNRIDKPSQVEKLRNETVQKIQGNRNPFVDYPDLVDQMFD